MQSLHSTPHGLWLPLITPFRDGKLDEAPARRLVSHYAAGPVNGLILAATTGEGLTLDEEETESLAELSAAERGPRMRLHLGLSGSDTRKGVKALQRTASWPIDHLSLLQPAITAGPVRAFPDPRRQH